MDLEQLRARIDDVDAKIIASLAERNIYVTQIAELKRKQGLSAVQTKRFEHMLNNRLEAGEAVGLPPRLVKKVWLAIHTASVRLQKDIM